MAFTPRTRLVNPRLGSYFGIFTSGFVAVLMLSLLFEQLGSHDTLVRIMMLLGPVLLYGGIGLLSPSNAVGDFFAAGRRVPAFFNGAGIAVAAMGGAGFLAITGTFFIAGVDAFALSLGWIAGIVFMAVLLAPFMRKFGAYTIPSFLGRRFESRTVRLAAAAVLGVPLLLLILAEARFAAYAAGWLMGSSDRWLVALVIIFVTTLLALGGMRALTWASVAKCIAAYIAVMVPVSIAAILVSKLPIPQMTHGNVLVPMTRMESARGVPFVVAPQLTVDLPGAAAEPLVKRFVQPFGSVGTLGFVLLTFVVAGGIAASPGLLARAGTTPGVYEARKSLGWSTLILGLWFMTLPAVAIYFRTILLEQVVGQPSSGLPEWFTILQQAGIARLEAKTQTVLLSQISFERDAALFSLPIAAGYPQAIVYLALAGALAAALAALASSLMAAAAILSEDVVIGLLDEEAPDRARIFVARLALAAIGFVAMWIAIIAPGDPLGFVIWALNILAASAFPVLLLSVWWKRTNAWGVLAGLGTGFILTVFLMLLSETGAIALPSAIAGAIAAPLALLAALTATLLTPVPGHSMLDIVRDLRVPGGETISDRETRLLRLKVRAQT
ncbi:MAG: sodium:solute symporter [Hyphomicrobiaceae bacterium]|nr:sodium:solute symporter [Hyphomicrobiaceae bacterium]